MSVKKAIWGSVAVLLGLGLLVWLAVVRPFLVGGRQILNYAHMQYYMGALDEYYKEHGEYPGDLVAAVSPRVAQYPSPRSEELLAYLDTWEHPLVYRTDGQHYVLASYGKDGRPDSPTLPAYDAEASADKHPCYSLKKDTVVSDRGIHQGCYK